LPLISLYQSSPDALQEMTIQQIVGLAGDGKLTDDAESQHELQEYLALVEPEKLGDYAQYCLDTSFAPDSGFALQDIVNEIGRRLGFKVINGRYRGKRNENGFDGLWESKYEGAFVVETKTTAAYTITLETIAKYRDGLINEGKISKDAAILFVVGRQDTLALEQQIRGSKFAWSMRVVSIDSLIKLMHVNLSSLSQEVTTQIHKIFKPIDYTRVDPIVDVIFTTAEDKDESTESEVTELEKDDEKEKVQQDISREDRKAKRQLIADKFSTIKDTKLLKRKIALFSDSKDSLRVAISVSKRYDSPSQRYWYAYLEPMREFLSESNDSYVILGCMDLDEAYAIPFKDMEKYKGKMNATPAKNNRKEYWHVFIKDDAGKLSLYLLKDKTEIDLSQYAFKLI
jgi:hypothetical protein